ncbi:MAG: DUF4011 domain-containing protein [Alphaproteobacteria bacterium]|nr:MAG: DUF4011 domain-containing protein [Alphaproteobacteria bacterium]
MMRGCTMSVEQAHKETTDATSSMRHRTIGAILQESRTSLLDLTLRNRLLNIPKKSKSTTLLTIHHALSADLFRILVQEKKSMSFLPKLDKKDGEITCADDAEMIARNSDRCLPTMLTTESLQNRLLGMYYDARTLEEEQGVNILYLTLGTIKWYESDSSDRELYAPLLLIPVTLTRSTAKEQFHLSWREEDVSINLSLYTKMNMEFGCVLPELPPHDEIDISAYMRHVAESISSKKRWEIKEQDITLGFYSFAKFLMFRDLDVDLWPDTTRLDAHPLVAGLLGDGFPSSKEFLISEDSYVDDHLSIQEMYHVVDADSSQTVAIYEVLKGRDLVIQGPPGTGKSQTIANIIAGAVIQGKKVLFIAEKMAALEVVYRRLQYVGLDAMCLELHSHKSNKRHVLEELKKTMELGSPRGHDQGKSAKATAAYGAKLRDYALKLHSPLHPSGFTPYEIIGRLIALKNKGIDATAIVLSQPESWDSADYQQHKHLLADIAARLKQSGSMNKNPWRGVQCSSLSPKESQKLDSLLTQVTQQFHLMMTLAETIERHFPARNNATIGDFKKTHDLCRAYMALPHINIECIAQSAWIDNIQAVRDLLVTGQRFQELDTLISSVFKDIAKQHDFSECHQHLVMYGDSMLGVVHGKYRSSKKILASMLVGTLPKAHKEQLDVLEAMMSWQRAYKELEQHDAYGRELFGVHWKSHRTDWEQCTRLLEWRMGLSDTLVNLTLFKAFASIPSRDLIASMYEEYTTCVDDCTQQLEKLCALLDIDFPLAFGVESLEHVPRKAIKERLEAWSEHREGLLSVWFLFLMA